MKKAELKSIIKEVISELNGATEGIAGELKKLEFKFVSVTDLTGESIKGNLEEDDDEPDLWWLITTDVGQGKPFLTAEVVSARGAGVKGKVNLNVSFDDAGK